MILLLMVTAIGFSTFLIFPIGTALLTDMALYGSLFWYSLCFSKTYPKVSVSHWVLFLVTSAIYIAYRGFGLEQILPMTGVLIYGGFSIVFLVHWMLGLYPFTSEQKILDITFNRKISAFYALAAFLSMVLSVKLRPSPSAVWVPLSMFVFLLVMRTRIENKVRRVNHDC